MAQLSIRHKICGKFLFETSVSVLTHVATDIDVEMIPSIVSIILQLYITPQFLLNLTLLLPEFPLLFCKLSSGTSS